MSPRNLRVSKQETLAGEIDAIGFLKTWEGGVSIGIVGHWIERAAGIPEESQPVSMPHHNPEKFRHKLPTLPKPGEATLRLLMNGRF